MPPPSDQCAVGPDGRLLDASEITFYNDPDDENPLPASITSSMTPSSAPAVNAFDILTCKTAAQHPAAPKVAGARRSGRVSRPSGRVRNPDNAASTSVLQKRRSLTRSPSPPPKRGPSTQAAPSVSDVDDVSTDAAGPVSEHNNEDTEYNGNEDTEYNDDDDNKDDDGDAEEEQEEGIDALAVGQADRE
ncbi:hypothetical protein FA95DRAFT_1613436, partial [Auriscalpium vulgare]